MDSVSKQAASQAGLMKYLTCADMLQARWFIIPLDGRKSVSMMDPMKVATPSALVSTCRCLGKHCDLSVWRLCHAAAQKLAPCTHAQQHCFPLTSSKGSNSRAGCGRLATMCWASGIHHIKLVVLPNANHLLSCPLLLMHGAWHPQLHGSFKARHPASLDAVTRSIVDRHPEILYFCR